MRQTRLSIGCQDWQEIVRAIGPEAAGVLVYLCTLMRSMQASRIAVTIPELADAMKIRTSRAGDILTAIEQGGYLVRIGVEPGGVIVLHSPEEAKAIAERERKQRAKVARKFRDYTLFAQTGNSAAASEGTALCADQPARNTAQSIKKEYKSEVMMVYTEDGDGNSEYTLFDKSGNSGQKEKDPTPQKVKSLTESIGRAHASAPVREAELPADALEADYIDICGGWPPSLRKAILAEKDDVREAFYLYVRQRQTEDGKTWTADQVRIAWLAARRIPKERRAESILAASMGKWRTIRDAGSGCYFEKGTGRVVSLVRGPIETSPKNDSPVASEAADMAVRLAQTMRRG